MPAGQEAAAEKFYCDVLGFTRIAKPAHLQKRGGCWFESAEVILHLGVESSFVPARKAHPAFVVTGLAKLKARLNRAGFTIVFDTQVDGYERFYTVDPFGNRIELMQPARAKRAQPRTRCRLR